jgi:[glutamine synthetase] adenylyltransferase / [glutamine synthetase]-adenylyl-L-tyrosine phosphorylase
MKNGCWTRPRIRSAADEQRLERLALASPLYAQMLRQRPEICLWLEEERNLHTAYRYQALVEEWKISSAAADTDEAYFARLRQWRRLMSLRIAYRSVNGLADEPSTVGELTRLAEFCLRECLAAALRHWTARFGEPWDELARRPARFCILALGKLGGGELNFSSDIDLIYCYEGEGACRPVGTAPAASNAEFFTKVAETTTHLLNAQTADGFLFRVDVRLRPEGAWGPLVHALSAIENYYATAGQTWERLALLKARPVAGDLALGAELLEDLHSFRYPRRPPPSLLAEVAGMKLRTEREIGGVDARDRDVKRGPGGIREIEFIVQSLQLLHAGRYPFLQTTSTAVALEQLVRYELLGADDALFLGEAYWFLRRVEHALQMREERQTHGLPDAPEELGAVATVLGFDSAAAFLAALDARRRRVHALYAGLFSDRSVDRDYEAWWEFFTTENVPAIVAVRIARWFGGAPGASAALRLFVCGGHRPQVTRELVTRFQHLASNFDALFPQLAQPLETLARLARCAERYGTRQQFLNNCASNPHLLRALALLCDRSSYSVELLCAHPEILEEVLRPEMLRRRKTPQDLAVELRVGSGDPAWLWLYARAEQMRCLIGELLGFLTMADVEAGLTRLADAVLKHLCGDDGPLVVALGKYGGGELTFGSDLDLLFVAAEGREAAAAEIAETMRRALHQGGPLGAAFAVDLRLRPHGNAGPLATTLPALTAYHRQTWEKQLFTRARVVTGPPALAAAFRSWVDRLLYAAPLTDTEQADIWSMRQRIERERATGDPPERAFKTGAGGIIDCEFLAQTLQLRHGCARPELRLSATRATLQALAAAGLIPVSDAGTLLDNFDFLRRIEFALRRDANEGVSILPATPAERTPLARWLGFPDESAFWSDHVRRLHETRRLFISLWPARL